MDYYLFTARSITRSQKMDAELRRRGIRAEIVRPPSVLSEKGCAYALRLSPRHYASALRILTEKGIPPDRVYRYDGERYEKL